MQQAAGILSLRNRPDTETASSQRRFKNLKRSVWLKTGKVHDWKRVSMVFLLSHATVLPQGAAGPKMDRRLLPGELAALRKIPAGIRRQISPGLDAPGRQPCGIVKGSLREPCKTPGARDGCLCRKRGRYKNRSAQVLPAGRLEPEVSSWAPGASLRYRDSQIGQVISYKRFPYSDNPRI